MRIIGYIDDPVMKITLLEMNNRVSVKFEKDLMEQTYKLHLSGSAHTIELIKDNLTEEIRHQILSEFDLMKKTQRALQVDPTEQTEQSPYPHIV